MINIAVSAINILSRNFL